MSLGSRTELNSIETLERAVTRWKGGRVARKDGFLRFHSARPRTRERFSAIRSSASLWHPIRIFLVLVPLFLSLSLSLSLPSRLCRSEDSASRMRRSMLRQVSRVHSFEKRTRLIRQIIDSFLFFLPISSISTLSARLSLCTNY